MFNAELLIKGYAQVMTVPPNVKYADQKMQAGMLRTVLEIAAYYVFLYPIAMSVVWMVGGLYFWWRRERGRKLMPKASHSWIHGHR